MEIAKLVLEYLRALIWPAIVIVLFWLFRKHIITLLNSMTKFKGFGIDAEFEKRIAAQFKQIKDDIINTDENAIEAEKRITRVITAELGGIIENKIKHVNLENKIEHLEGNTKDSTMLAFAVALSIDENKKYNIYYDPASRSHNYPFKYIGLYHDKEIVAVGEVKKIIYCDYNIEKKKLIPTDGKELNLTEDEYDRIKDTILNTPYYDLEEGNKFFLVDNFYPTHFKKSSDYALRAKKYFWLNEIIGFHDGMTAAELAKLLSGREWE